MEGRTLLKPECGPSEPPTGKRPGPGSIDRQVSQNLRRLRHGAGMTLKTMAAELGVSYQLVNRMELGLVRLHVYDLLPLTRLLRVPIDMFFEMPGDGDAQVEHHAAEPTLGIIRAFASIPDEASQRALLAVSRALAGASLVAQQARELGLVVPDADELLGSSGRQPRPRVLMPVDPGDD